MQQIDNKKSRNHLRSRASCHLEMIRWAVYVRPPPHTSSASFHKLAIPAVSSSRRKPSAVSRHPLPWCTHLAPPWVAQFYADSETNHRSSELTHSSLFPLDPFWTPPGTDPLILIFINPQRKLQQNYYQIKENRLEWKCYDGYFLAEKKQSKKSTDHCWSTASANKQRSAAAQQHSR